MGLSEEQVTAMCFRNPDVEIPEQFYFFQKTGVKHLKNILVYDAWWRFFRNLKVKSIHDIEKYKTGTIHPVIREILKDVNSVSEKALQNGIISKSRMTLSYLKNRKKIQ